MVAAIRRTLTVSQDGTLEVHAPKLAAGMRAEIIIFLEPEAEPRDGPAAVAALEALQAGLSLDQAGAAEWMRQNEALRVSLGPRE